MAALPSALDNAREELAFQVKFLYGAHDQFGAEDHAKEIANVLPKALELGLEAGFDKWRLAEWLQLLKTNGLLPEKLVIEYTLLASRLAAQLASRKENAVSEVSYLVFYCKPSERAHVDVQCSFSALEF